MWAGRCGARYRPRSRRSTTTSRATTPAAGRAPLRSWTLTDSRSGCEKLRAKPAFVHRSVLIRAQNLFLCTNAGLTQAHDLTLVVDVDPHGVRARRQAGHRSHFAADRVDEPSTDRCTNLAHRQLPPRRRALELRVGRDGQVALGDAHAELAETIALVRVDLLARRRVVLDTVRAVDLRGDRLDFLAQRHVRRIEKAERARLLGGLGHHVRKLDGAGASVGEVVTYGRAH